MSSFSELRKKRKGTTSPPNKEPVIVPEPVVVKPVVKPVPVALPVIKPVPIPVPVLDPAPIIVPDPVVKRQRKQVIEEKHTNIINSEKQDSILGKLEHLEKMLNIITTITPPLPVENHTDKLFAALNYRDFLLFLRENRNLHEMIPYHLKRIDSPPYRDKKGCQDYIDLIRLFLQKILEEE